jgi:hypothetical protein
MNRRMFVFGGTLFGLTTIGMPALAQTHDRVERQVAAVLTFLETRRANEGPKPSLKDVADRLGNGLNAVERRIAAFELVRRLPYRLARFNPQAPDEIFLMGQGDCRHKSVALRRLLQAWGEKARPVQVPFDWKDLPIPARVLSPLSETRSFHDAIELEVDGTFVLVDATWDPALRQAGFPLQPAWDGRSPTLPVTPTATTVIRPGSYKTIAELYERYRIGWPQREKTLAFNRAFNAWTDELRRNAGGKTKG